MSREKLITYIDKKKPVLEIGPLACPFLKKIEFNAFYADIRDKEEIYRDYCADGASYETLGLSSKKALYDTILDIDYIVDKGYKNAVNGRQFAAVFSSHVIEHTTDLLRHLQDVGDCLEEGGNLVLCIPDKRFTFDHFRAVTPFRDVWDVFNNGRGAVARLAFDHGFTTHWINNHQLYRDKKISFSILAAEENKCTAASNLLCETEQGACPNGHLWVFTDVSFLELIRDCLRMNTLPFSLEYAEETQPGANEFHVVLKKDSRIREDKTHRIHQILQIQEQIDAWKGGFGLHSVRAFCAGGGPVYIYGAGNLGQVAYTLLKENFGVLPAGYIVSDGEPLPEEITDTSVVHFSEIADSLGKIRIVLAIGKDTAVEKNLVEKECDFINIFKK